jgi:hypothetical protein
MSKTFFWKIKSAKVWPNFQKYDILVRSYENIFDDVSNDIDFVVCMWMILILYAWSTTWQIS